MENCIYLFWATYVSLQVFHHVVSYLVSCSSMLVRSSEDINTRKDRWGHMRTEEGRVFWKDGVKWGQKCCNMRSCEDTGGGGGGSFEKRGVNWGQGGWIGKGSIAGSGSKIWWCGIFQPPKFSFLLCSLYFHWWPAENIDWEEGSIVVYEPLGPPEGPPPIMASSARCLTPLQFWLAIFRKGEINTSQKLQML